MKKVCFLMVMALFFAGNATAGSIPDLTGVWQSVKGEMHWEDRGFLPEPFKQVFIIKEQKGRLISGVKSWMTRKKGGKRMEGFSAIIGVDNKTLYFAEHQEGIAIGELMGANTMAFYYLEGGGNAKAVYLKLRRQK